MTVFSWLKLLPAPVVPGRPLNDLMADPLVQLVMAADRFTEAEVRRFCGKAK